MKKKKKSTFLSIKLWLLPARCFFFTFSVVSAASVKRCCLLVAKCTHIPPPVLLRLATDAKLMMFYYWSLLKGRSPLIKLFWFSIANSDLKERVGADKMLQVSLVRRRNEVMQLMPRAAEASGRALVMGNNSSKKIHRWFLTWLHRMQVFMDCWYKHTLMLLPYKFREFLIAAQYTALRRTVLKVVCLSLGPSRGDRFREYMSVLSLEENKICPVCLHPGLVLIHLMT